MTIVGAATIVPASPVSAAVTVGETFTPTSNFAGAGGSVQTASPGNGYTIPTPGVITSWSYQGGGVSPPAMKLKIHRFAGGSDFLIVGASSFELPGAGILNTFPTRIAVKAGDRLGTWYSDTTQATRITPGFTLFEVAGPGTDTSPGSTATFLGPVDSVQIDIAAKLEPDADNDGFGDETQDLCPSDATTQGPCPDRTAPETTITAKPKAKSNEKKAKFAFTSSEAGSSFECSLDGGPFEPCTSPKTYKVKKGKHTFAVRARDAAGNLDPTPATYSWKVKKKKKRR